LHDDDGPLRRLALDGGRPVVGARHAADATAEGSGSRRALDWFVFFVADIQTGFGPFIAVYLTAAAWSQGDIGLVLTIGGLVALAGQMPGGALLDAVRSTRWAAALAVLAIGISALVLALWPIFTVVLASRVLHAAASCVVGPAIVAISLGLVGHAALGERIGRNVRFMSIGAGLSAAAMGATGHLLSNQSVFLVTAALVVPALFALARIRAPGGEHASAAPRALHAVASTAHSASLLRNRPLIIFAGCILLFHLANAAMLPLMGGALASRVGQSAMMMVAACMIVPQVVVAAFSPWIGRQAGRWGRKPLLFAAFAALAIRAALFAVVTDPYLIVVIQLLDGVSAAALGVMFPLVVADVTRGSGRFNLALGVVGSAIGIGASLSTTLAGYMVDHFGRGATFLSLALLAAAGLALLTMLMPETRPNSADGEASAAEQLDFRPAVAAPAHG
jgi:predicted MFS family arabinose efflux permease